MGVLGFSFAAWFRRSRRAAGRTAPHALAGFRPTTAARAWRLQVRYSVGKKVANRNDRGFRVSRSLTGPFCDARRFHSTRL